MQSYFQYRAMRHHLQSKVDEHNLRSDSGSGDSSSDEETSKLSQRLAAIGVKREEGEDKKVKFIVDFAEDGDELNPQDWSKGRKWRTTGIVGLTGFLVGWASAIDSEAYPQAAEEFGVSAEVEILATALYLIAFGCGTLISGPMSETVGRNPTYLITLFLFLIWIMASALAPNIGAQLAFRFLAGFFGCTPLTTFGGSVHDMWDDAKSTYVFPVMASLSFIGPFIAPLVGAFIGQYAPTWRWTEWCTLIMGGVITGTILFFADETYPPILLGWKAKLLREITGDDRYISSAAIDAPPFGEMCKQNLLRPFKLFFTQIIVVLWCAYLSLVYIVLFTFLPGYDYIFEEPYGFSQSTTGLMYIGLNVGFLISLAICPWIYSRYKKKVKENDGKVPPEERLVYAMIAAPCLPISLFWMGWTCGRGVSYWSPLIASVVFGFAMLSIFISAYLYLIDTFAQFAASALVSLTLTRYIGAGAMTIAANPMYQGIGAEWTLTLLGCLGLLCLPIPFVLFKMGGRIRAKNPVE